MDERYVDKAYLDWEREYERKRKVVELAQYYVDYKCSIRDVAKEFMVSKSTVHRWFHTILPYLEEDGYVEDKSLWEEVQYQLSYNKRVATDRMIELSRRYHR